MLIVAAVIAVGAALVGLVKEANALSQEFGGGVKANLRIGLALKPKPLELNSLHYQQNKLEVHLMQ